MKTLALIAFLCLIFVQVSGQDKNLYSFKAKTIEGEVLNFADLKGKKILLVNTASKCGLTPQYKDLQTLFETFGGDSFTIVGFPANNFGKQEPGSNHQISEFCSINYGVTFQMMEKIDVKGGNIHPIYSWLTRKSENGQFDAPVSWNFQKFMIDENGNLVGFAPPKEKPDSERIVNWIKTGQL